MRQYSNTENKNSRCFYVTENMAYHFTYITIFNILDFFGGTKF